MKSFQVLPVLILTFVLIIPVGSSYAGPQKSAEMPQQAPSSLSGKVVESMNSGGYTYVNIEKDGKQTWVAVPNMKVSVGQDVSFQPGMVMRNFKSKSLDRTFESIVFSGGAIGKQDTKSVRKPSGSKKVISAGDKIKVEKASGPDAYTVAEIYEKSTELDRKGVVIRGQVVKFSPMIMGKNWIHIQDGSGNSSSGTNDIIVTSQDVLSVGDVVTVQGTLYTDKDFGSGYKYAVIVEEARFNK